MNNHRNFKIDGESFAVIKSNNSGYKWQVMTFDEEKKYWTRLDIYAGTIAEAKERTKDKIDFYKSIINA